MTLFDSSDPIDELSQLRTEMAEMRAEIEGLRSALASERPASPSVDDGQIGQDAVPSVVSRRHALRSAGVLAAGAVAGGVGLVAAASPAAAASGNFDGSPAVFANGGSSSGSIGVDAQVQGAGSWAVLAVSTGNDGRGVNSTATGSGGVGVYGEGGMAGVFGYSLDGMGVYAQTNGNTAGVYGDSRVSTGTNAVGVVGYSAENIGVRGTGARYGVWGETVDGTGVLGSGTIGAYFYGADASVSIGGTGAHLRFAGAAVPTSTSIAHEKADVIVDSNGVMWICTAAGTPGTWLQVAGAGTAGAFHALTPGRVYDSRLGSPAPGPMSPSSASRTVSVANKINSSTGVVVTSNFVPSGATAVFANVTIADTTTSGYLAINPGGVTTRDASTINWAGDGLAIANGVVLTLNASRQVTIVQGGPGSANVLIDVIGYYR